MKLWHLGTFLFLYILYHLFTLSISPIVWTDEVAFNSMTLDWLQNGTYRMLCDFQYSKGANALAYGPVWFFFNGIILNNLSNNPFYGRLLGLIAGILLILLFAKWFGLSKKKDGWLIILLFAAFCLDPFLNANMHRGRNDSLAIFFFYLSNFFLLKGYVFNTEKKIEFNYKYILLSSVVFSISALTTARIIMLSPAIFFVFVYFLFYSRFSIKYISSGIIWLLITAVFYLTWIYKGFGGIHQYFEYYKNVNSQNSSFFGGNLLLPIEVKPLLACFIISILVFFIKFNNSKINSVTIFCFGVILCFYILVGDTGPYSVYVIPAFYLWLYNFIKIDNCFTNKYFNYFRYIIVVILLLFNLFVFGLKNIVLLSDYEARNTLIVNNFIKKNIPQNAKVCADEVYYYSVLENNDKFHLMISYQSEKDYDSIELYARQKFDFDYLIVSERLKDRCPSLISLYISNSSLKAIDTLQIPHNSISKLIQPISGYNLSTTGYDGVIYKRIKLHSIL